MRIAFDDFLTLGWMPSRIRPPQLSLTLFVKGTFKLVPGGPAVPVEEEPEFPLGDVFWDEDPAEGFEARVRFLFDETIPDHLDIESIVFLAERVMQLLEE